MNPHKEADIRRALFVFSAHNGYKLKDIKKVLKKIIGENGL